ncbi:hypothetical protein [Streptomyces sp. NPDC017529]|uniref:hypothetical protein n=1 Tax=Streptomyces sp. NPDC017529 TaxID=3365000 RepID=UPI0037B8A644
MSNEAPATSPDGARYEWDTVTLSVTLAALEEAADHVRAYFAERPATSTTPCHIRLELPAQNSD